MITVENNTIEILAESLRNTKSSNEKLSLLNKFYTVKRYFSTPQPIAKFIESASIEVKIALLSIIAIGEGPIVFRGYEEGMSLDALTNVLIDTERFYDSIGGIVGYHFTVMKLINEMKPSSMDSRAHFGNPDGIDTTKLSKEVREAVRWGIEHLHEMGEIYPVGGAGDRLNLKDDETNNPLPAASLHFCGKTLLEGLIHDLEAREYLHFKLTGKKVTTPIALMTSAEKDNDHLIKEILKNNNWFGRPQESFKIFCQPLVPLITVEGHWSMSDVLIPTLKPGGHGVIWKVAEDNGVFDWFTQQNRIKVLVRQINNPIAAVDYGLLGFIGIGMRYNKSFGFLSCKRLPNTAEGALVQFKRKNHFTISNIEYTNFEQYGLKDGKYPTNTNILFVDLNVIRSVLKKCPIPGMIINLKSKAPFYDKDGNFREVNAGRLESTMQNISDCIEEGAYLTINERSKTISAIKKSSDPQNHSLETPETAFEDIQANGRDLLRNYCGYEIPDDLLFLYSPSLGPLYSIISQKLKGGKILPGSELQLHIATVNISNIHLSGSLLITGPSGKCILEDVTVDNQGISRSSNNVYWKNGIDRFESLSISIQGTGEFVAKNIVFTGSHVIVVPDGFRVTAHMDDGKISYLEEKILHPSWEWKYSFDRQHNIALRRRLF